MQRLTGIDQPDFLVGAVAEVQMDAARARAYRLLLSQGFLHLKWDLAGFYGGFSLTRPWRLPRVSRAIRIAACRAFAFHNLAIFAAHDFANFSEERFWADIEMFHRDFPDALCPYRNVFERCLRGEPVTILAPDGVGQLDDPASDRGSGSL